MSDRENRPARPRTSLVDRGWDEIPNAIPDDTVVDPTVDSKELTSPDPSRRPAELAAKLARAPGPSALGLPPASKTPASGRASTPPPPPARAAGRPSVPPPPPSGRASVPPSAPLRPSAPPPPPSQRASTPPARPSTPPPAPQRVSRPPPPAAMLDTLSESLDAIVAEPPRVEPPPAAEPIVAPPRGLSSASLAPTQPSPMVEAPGPPSSAWPGPPSSRALALEELPSLKDALAQRVRVGQGAGPLWGFAVIAVALGLGTMALFSGSCSALLARGTAPAAAPSGARGAPSALASVAPPASTPSPAPEPPEPRALPPGPSLDKSALEALEARPPRQRSVDDVLAMGSARAAEKRRAVGDDAAKASQNPLYAGSPELTAKLKTAALDPDTMREALAAMAKLPSPAGADLLYSIWTTRKKSDPAALLAEALLATDDVRSRASPALRVVLDLRAAESCDSVKDALTRALEHGDRRVVPLLGRFSQKKGCGDDKQGDCWPCLREGEELKAAAKSVGTRAPPKL